jgi:hypothetical protein
MSTRFSGFLKEEGRAARPKDASREIIKTIGPIKAIYD